MTTTPNDIKTQLRTYLPTVTDLFTSSITASATASGNTITLTSTAHGLAVGKKVNLSAGRLSNTLSSVVDNGDGTVRFGTTDEHDLTEAKEINDPTTLTLDGFGDTWDGIHTIVSIPNRMFFEIAFPDGIVILPTLTAATVLLEDRSAGIVGVHSIDSVPTDDTFTVVVNTVPSFPTGIIEGITVVTGVRIWSAANFERSEEIYTEKSPDNLALFLIMNDVDISKDRQSLNDSVGAFTRADFGRQTILQNFTTLVFFPTNDGDKAGGKAQQQAYDEVFKALYSTLYGVKIDDPDSKVPYVIVSNGHGPGAYNTAYYTHAYEWQAPSVLTFDNGFNQQPDVAFRDIDGTFNMALDLEVDEESQLLIDIDLDEEPL